MTEVGLDTSQEARLARLLGLSNASKWLEQKIKKNGRPQIYPVLRTKIPELEKLALSRGTTPKPRLVGKTS